MLRTAILGLLACLVAACGQPDDHKNKSREPANPLLWEIARADQPGPDPQAGEAMGWLLGTIHALPDDAQWRTRSTDRAIAEADVLAVEIADLGDGGGVSSAFLSLAYSAGQPALTARVPAAQRGQLADLIDETSYRLDDFERIESWGAALILAQAIGTDAKSANGIDRALLRDFASRRVVELEGARAQFEAFDGLSEGAQRAMLAAIVEESQSDKEALERPIRVYLAGDEAGLEKLSYEGMLANSEIRNALLTRRNASWLPQIEALLADGSRPLIAVGAAHMVGEDGLVALLEANGYRVTRMR